MAAGSNVGPGRKWKKGESGNPKGRPKKGESFTDILTAMAGIKDVRLGDGTAIERKRALCEMFWQKALRDKDSYAGKFIVERIEGKTPQPITGGEDEDGNDLPVAIVQTVQRMSLEEWEEAYKKQQAAQSSGSPSPDKPKPSPAPRKNSSSAGRKAAAKATSSSATTSRTTKSGAKRGKASSSAARTKS